MFVFSEKLKAAIKFRKGNGKRWGVIFFFYCSKMCYNFGFSDVDAGGRLYNYPDIVN